MERSSIPDVKTSGYYMAPIKDAVGAKQDIMLINYRKDASYIKKCLKTT